MIVVGAYPDGFEATEATQEGLKLLASIVSRTLPPNVGLHVLPVGPSSGDSGFACNDWFQVHESLGNWLDISSMASQRKVIMDGIYNHVGMGHRFAREFFHSPEVNKDMLHALQSDDEPEIPRSPRGGCALRRHIIDGHSWLIWQTFSEHALDIQLDAQIVQEEIERHLDFLADLGVWGLRLDGPAYFGKQLGIQNHRHHPDAYRLSRQIADKALRRGFAVNAQLDCDVFGLEYFPRSLGYDVPIIDYSYSAYLIHALLEGSTDDLSQHIRRTWQMRQTIIYCPRTFDGILLRSKNLEPSVIKSLLRLAHKYNLPLRVIDGSPYEINSSFPYICSLGVRPEQMRERLEICIAVTGFLPGWCYVYMPLLFGYMPEYDTEIEEDPRLLNRHPIPASVQASYVDSDDCTKTGELLNWLASFSDEFGEHEDYASDSVISCGVSLLRLRRKHARMQLLANFSHDHSADVKNLVSGDLVVGRRCGDGVLAPLGFGIWRY